MPADSFTQHTEPQRPRVTRLLEFNVVLEMTSYAKTSLREAIARGDFPSPVRLGAGGRRIAFYEHEIEAWLASRPRVVQAEGAA